MSDVEKLNKNNIQNNIAVLNMHVFCYQIGDILSLNKDKIFFKNARNLVIRSMASGQSAKGIYHCCDKHAIVNFSFPYNH